MKTFRKNPHIYQINLMNWLSELSQREQKEITLSNIPEAEWEDIKSKGMDLVWMMGVWQRSPDAREKARKVVSLAEVGSAILPDFEIVDLSGSPYAIFAYVPDPQFGSVEELLALRGALEEKGLGLVLDFVPNHTSCDHPWVRENPGYYVQAGQTKREKCPEGFFCASDTQGKPCIAHGRDPYCEPWTDTAQVNYANQEAAVAMAETLLSISRFCHGLRCDMAMLVLTRVFRETWNQFLQDDMNHPEFWSTAIKRLRSSGHSCLLLAEAYWGVENELINLGFDYAYDKNFYDLLVKEDVQELKDYLSSGTKFQQKMIRFLENHDEERAMTVFGPERIQSAMVVHGTLPGMRFWQHGQFHGNRIRVPVQLRRGPVEPVQSELNGFSELLLREVNHPVFHDGAWNLCETYGWENNPSHRNLIAWCWRHKGERRLIVVNLTSYPSQGYVRFPEGWLPEEEGLLLRDPLKGERYLRSVYDLKKSGLYVDLEGRTFHFFRIEHSQRDQSTGDDI